MARSQESSNKKEVRNKKDKKRKDKEKKRLEKKANFSEAKSFEDMIAYVDENGRLTSTRPEFNRKNNIIAADIQVSTPKREADEGKNLIRKGIVTFFDDSKGFGFIKVTDSGQSVFVHANSLIDRIKENNKVTFLIQPGQRGPVAVDVKLDK